ncbi:MAG: peptide-methionine (S)-S-oxide reductase MsrA [Pseudomonadota bacterium]|nr:peptide-methionine (S)-S-oxide reductase MsrA [Pseudomonadota bacterium]
MSIKHPLATQPRVKNQFATLGGGCFWCLEAVYEEVQGVVDVESGYAGGHVANPEYGAVCDGTTGHAEVVRVEFDPQQIAYREILEIFFVIHDPTTLNRQGNDSGTQYRSVIFYHSDEQRSVAEAVMREAQTQWSAPLVTQVLPAPNYYRAENHHQEYYRHNQSAGYCVFVVSPKVAKFRKTFTAKRKNSMVD